MSWHNAPVWNGLHIAHVERWTLKVNPLKHEADSANLCSPKWCCRELGDLLFLNRCIKSKMTQMLSWFYTIQFIPQFHTEPPFDYFSFHWNTVYWCECLSAVGGLLTRFVLVNLLFSLHVLYVTPRSNQEYKIKSKINLPWTWKPQCENCSLFELSPAKKTIKLDLTRFE